MLGGGVDPGDDEHRVTLAHRPADERVLRLHVEDVVLVDPGRHDHQRPAVDLLRRRRVLNELHQLVLVDDLARCRRDVLAEPERFHIGQRDLQRPSAAFHVVEKVGEAAAEVLAVALGRRPDDFGICRDEVGRRDRAQELAHVEQRLLPGLRVEPVGAGDHRLQPPRGEQIELLDRAEGGVGAPVLVLEPAIAWLGLDDRRRRFAAAAPPPWPATAGRNPRPGFPAPSSMFRAWQGAVRPPRRTIAPSVSG